MPNSMSAIPRFVRAGMVAFGLLVGCDDELGHDRYVWDSNAAGRGSDAARLGDTSADHDGNVADARDASVDADAGETSSDGFEGGASDASLDARVDASIDGLIDAAESGPLDWGDAGALHAVLSLKSPACLACTQASCPSEIVGCSSVPGKPDGGPDAGLSRSQLCVETLQCLLATGCEAVDTSTCYCGPKVVPVPDLCTYPGTAEGVCKAPLERSLESTDPKVVLASMLSTDHGGGWAMLLTRCMRDNACASCFPAIDGGADAKLPSLNASP
jgi:hypothetical protein